MNSAQSNLPIGLTFITLFFVSTGLFADNLDINTPEDAAGYSIGANIGINLKSQGLSDSINVDSLLLGIADGISGNLILTQEEIIANIETFNAVQTAKTTAIRNKALQLNKDYLSENALKSGVVTNSSGLQFLPLTIVDSDAPKPKATDTVQVRYQGTFINGTVFDSTLEDLEPISFALNSVIAGWSEGLQLMKIGEKFRFFLPADLAYGESGFPQAGVPPDMVLIFDVELFSISEI